MSIRLGSNTLSLGAQRRLAESSSSLSRTLERLSSGQRINRASDDAAGLAVSSTLRSNARVYSQAIRNGNDAMSALAIAEGTLGQMSGILVRLRELATQSANGSLSRVQRLSLDDEGEALSAEFNRIAASTRFNGLGLFDTSVGSLRAQLGFGVDGSIDMQLSAALRRKVGNGTFASSSRSLGDEFASAQIASGDFDGDGDQDLAVRQSGLGNGLRIFINNGSGSFTGTQSLVPSSGGRIVAADLNGDGIIDLGLGTTTGISVYAGTGTGTFATSATTSAVGNSSTLLQMADVDGDGAMDFVSAFASTITILKNNGQGTFSVLSTINNGATVNHLSVADLEGDGRADIVASTTASTTIRSYRNSGSGSFSSAVATNLGGDFAGGVSVGDFNNDGLLDLVAIGAGSLRITRGDGNGGFQTAFTQAVDAAATGPLVADLTGDGLLDISYGTNLANFLVTGNGDLTTSAPLSSGTGFAGGGQLAVDLNGDGVRDIVGSANLLGNWVVGLTNTVDSTNVERFNLTTRNEALLALEGIERVFQRVSNELGNIGALQSRIEVGLRTLLSIRENSEAAAARISDVDTAFESAAFVRLQILQQAGSSVLAQANQAPALALQLLGQ